MVSVQLVVVLLRLTMFFSFWAMSPTLVMPVPRSVKFSSWFVLHLAMLLVAAFLQTLVTLADVGGSIWMVGAKLLSSLLVGLLPSSCLPAASVSAWLGAPPLISWWPAAVGFHWLSTATNRLEGLVMVATYSYRIYLNVATNCFLGFDIYQWSWNFELGFFQ